MQVADAARRFPQVFSLSVESNLAPKYRYLVEHLGGDVGTLVAYPGYLSLSLSNRCEARTGCRGAGPKRAGCVCVRGSVGCRGSTQCGPGSRR